MGFFTLYVEEMKTLVRGRFALFGAAAILTLLTVLAAAVAPGYDSQWAFLFLAYAILPSALVPFAALRVAGPRASRFVQAVFTAPVSRASYFFVQLFVCLSVGALYIVATLPPLLVYNAHVGIPGDYARFVGVGVGMVLYACAVGLLLGTLFPGRSVVAPVSLSAVPVFLAFALPFALQVFAGTSTGITRELLVRIVHLSPHLNLLDAQVLVPGFWPQHHERSMIAMIVSLGLCILLAAWAYLGHQGVETWESSAGLRSLLYLGVIVALAFPVFMPAMTYDLAPAPREGFDQSGWVQGALLLQPGDPIPAGLYTPDQPQDPNPKLEAEHANRRELVLLLPDPGGMGGPPEFKPVMTKLVVNAKGTGGLILTGANNITVTPVTVKENFTFQRQNEDGSQPKALVLRFPVQVTPTNMTALADVPYGVRIHLNVTMRRPEGGPDGQTRFVDDVQSGKGLLNVHASYPGAPIEILVATVPLPIVFLVVGIARQIRRG